MSIIAPAISRWSGPSGPAFAPLADRGVLVGRGRVGRVRQRRVEHVELGLEPVVEISGASSFTRALTACISAIASEASAPVRLASPIALAPALRLGPRPPRTPAAARSSRSRGRERLPRSRSSEPSPRRATGARAGSGIPGDRPQVEHGAYPAGGQSDNGGGARRQVHVGAGELREELGQSNGLRALDDVLRHRARREAAVADGVQRAVLASPCADRSSGRPCTHGSARWSRSPAYPLWRWCGSPSSAGSKRTAASRCPPVETGGDALLPAGDDTHRGRGERNGDQQQSASPRHRVRQHRGPMALRRRHLDRARAVPAPGARRSAAAPARPCASAPAGSP